jgi:hypothetical protein
MRAQEATALPTEDRSARLTILVDPRKKALFESLCAEEDQTPSQVVRRLIRAYIEQRTGKPWKPESTSKTAADDKKQ